MNRIGLMHFVHLGLAAAILITSPDAFAQSRAAAAVASFASVDSSGNATPGCGGGGNALTTTLNNVLGSPGFDDEGVSLASRRAVYRFCDFLTPTGANGWTGDEVATADEALGMATLLAPDETFAAMDNANAAFDLQTANVARRLSLIRLSRRLDRDAAEQLARATSTRPHGTAAVTSSGDPNQRGAVGLSQADRGERVLLALQNGINAGDEIGGEGIGFFLNGRIHVVEGDANPSEQASDGFGGGFTLGGDMAISDQLYAGMALGYTRIDTNYNRSASDSSLDAVTISFYGAWFPIDDLFVDGSISTSWLGIDVSNQVLVFDGGPAIGSLDGDTDGVNFGFDLGTGYNLAIPWVDGLSVEPFLRLSLLYTEIDGFKQTGGDGTLNLDFNTQRTTSVTSSLGFRSEYVISTRYGVLTPYFRAAYVREFNKENDTLSVSLAAVPGSGNFKLRPEATDSNYANFGVGIAATLGQGFSEFLDYDVVAAHENVTIHQLTAGIRLEF